MKNLLNKFSRTLWSFLLGWVVTSQSLIVGAQAKEIFVAENGNDRNSGSLASPLLTINRGLAMADTAGDIVTVRAGTYRERVVINRSGTANARLVLRGYTAPDGTREMPKIVSPFHGILVQHSAGIFTEVEWVTIDGFEISGAVYDGIKLYSAKDIIIKNNYIHNNKCNGILGRGSKVLVENNVIADNGFIDEDTLSNYNKFHGMYITGSDFTIINNIFFKNMAYGIQVAGYDCSESGGTYKSPYCGATNFQIINNTFAYQRYRGGIIWYESGTIGGKAQNNIFFNNSYDSLAVGASLSTNGPELDSSGGGQVTQNNLYYSSIGAPDMDSLISDAAAVRENPKLVSAIPNDPSSPELINISPETDPLAYSRIKALTKFQPPTPDGKRSPAIDKGLEHPSVTKDLDGVLRPQGGAYDIGAYEYSEKPMPPTKLQVF